MNEIKWWHRIKMPDGTYTPGMVHHGPDGGDWPTTRFGMPENLIGKTVLDIGAWDGFFSFEAENRGARRVWAIDCDVEEGGNWGATKGFNYARRVLKSHVIYDEMTVEEAKHKAPRADVVLFYGVLYHLKSPLTGLEAALSLAKEQCLIETAIANEGLIEPLLTYKPNHANDPTNYFYPNTAWIQKVCEVNGFSCERIYKDQGRATYRAVRNGTDKRI